MFNLTAHLTAHAATTPDAMALIADDLRLDWRSLHDRVLHLAAALRARGVGPDVIVALMMKNSPACIELFYALSHLGAVVLPLNFRLSGDEAAYIVTHAGAALVIADRQFEAQAGAAGLPLIVLDAPEQRDLGAALLDATAGRQRDPGHPRGRDDIYRLMYTSGTTSRPKGVVHTYDNFLWKSFAHVLELGLGRQTRIAIVGPLYHVGGCDLPGLGVHLAGGCIVLMRDFDPRAVLETIARERVEGIWLAPVMASDILGLPAEGLPDVSCLRWCIAGGERTPESRIRAFIDRFPGARYIDAYGMTETVSGDTMMEPGREMDRIGSVGRPVRFVEIEIRDDEGRALPPGHEGEICIRGPKVMREYWRAPDKTAEAFHADGFLRSGDVGWRDEEGFVFITDRQKDMIISGGENIASSEVERVIYELPAVREAAVFARPDPRWGEVAVAALVLAPGAELSYAELASHCRANLAGFKCPRDMIMMDALPRNPSGKVLKRTLRELDAAPQPGG